MTKRFRRDAESRIGVRDKFNSASHFMKITKLGHCCLLIEEKGIRILTDPGSWTSAQNKLTNIDLILITHEHPDHLHVESVQAILKNNSNAKIITNTAVGKILASENIPVKILEHGQNRKIKDIIFEGFGNLHEEIYKEVGRVQNTGYFIDGKLFYPGDAFTDPEKSVDILALPVAGPWMKIKDAIEYGIKIKPRVCFPVHELMIDIKLFSAFYRVPTLALTENGIKFEVLELGKEYEL